MRMYDLIIKKRNGLSLTKEEIEFMVNGFTQGEIPDYQMSAMLMAIVSAEISVENPAKLSSLSMVPPVCPSPLPLILATEMPHAATIGVSASDVLSPTPPVLCLSIWK